jgi:hypothetical protein
VLAGGEEKKGTENGSPPYAANTEPDARTAPRQHRALNHRPTGASLKMRSYHPIEVEAIPLPTSANSSASPPFPAAVLRVTRIYFGK